MEKVARTWTAMERFGGSVMLDGNLVIVGATGADAGGEENRGAAYAFHRSGTSWSQEQRLLADVASCTSVAVSGHTAVVGAIGVEVSGEDGQGQTYFFERRPHAFEVYLPLMLL